jgi:hypothetical protein
MYPILADAGQNQAMVVAVALIACIVIIMVAAIVKYSVQDVIKIWSILGVLTGLVTGSVGSYFFTKPQLDAAQQRAQTAASNSQQIAELSDKVGLENLASMSPTETSTLLHNANLNTAATKPAEWRANVLRLHTLTTDTARFKEP